MSPFTMSDHHAGELPLVERDRPGGEERPGVRAVLPRAAAAPAAVLAPGERHERHHQPQLQGWKLENGLR